MGKVLIVELDDAVAEELETVAPAASRKRSSFVRRALRKALDEAAEERMRAGYRKAPDRKPAAFYPETWEPRPRHRRPRRK
jgi:predicted transcriptional regulator